MKDDTLNGNRYSVYTMYYQMLSKNMKAIKILLRNTYRQKIKSAYIHIIIGHTFCFSLRFSNEQIVHGHVSSNRVFIIVQRCLGNTVAKCSNLITSLVGSHVQTHERSIKLSHSVTVAICEE